MTRNQQFRGRFANNLRLIACLIVMMAFGMADFLYADAGCCLASASASGIKVKTSVLNKTIGSTAIGCNGGNKNSSFSTIEIPDVLDAVAVQTSASGTTSQTSSQSRVDNVKAIAGENVITATQLSSNAQTSCNGKSTANSIIQNLRINGQPVNVTGEPNQEISITGGKITINAQKFSGSGCVRKVNVTALTISVVDAAEMTFASSHAGVACVIFSCN